MKKILLICFTNLKSDPRIIKQFTALKDHYSITAIGTGEPGVAGVRYIPYVEADRSVSFHLKFPTLVRKGFSLLFRVTNRLKALAGVMLRPQASVRHLQRYWQPGIKDLLNHPYVKSETYDLIYINDLNTLPLGVRLAEAKNAKLIADLHEYSPKEFEGDPVWVKSHQAYYTFLCDEYLKRADVVINTCDSFANEYKKNFGVDSVIVTNAVRYLQLEPSQLSDNKIRLVHHGIAIPQRQIEQFIEMMKFLDDRFSLDLMLVPNASNYFLQLKEKIANAARVRLVPPVPTEQISECVNKYDVGICYLPFNGFNNGHSLPNKLFEYVQGRLAVLTAPSVEVSKVVRKYDIGVVSEDFTPRSMAEAIQKLMPERVYYYKQQSHKHARELSAEKNYEIMRTVVSELLSSKKTEDIRVG